VYSVFVMPIQQRVLRDYRKLEKLREFDWLRKVRSRKIVTKSGYSWAIRKFYTRLSK